MSFFTIEREIHTATQIMHQFSRSGLFLAYCNALDLVFLFYALSNKKKSFSNILYHLPLKTVNLDGVY